MAPITRWRHDPRYLGAVMRRKRLLTSLVHGSGLFRVIDAAWPPNRRVEVTRHRVLAPLGRPVRLALVSDLHVVRPGPREARVLEILERERPDAIALNGDFTALGGRPEDCGAVLAGMRAPLGVWATLGNWDYGHPVSDWRSFLAEHGVRLLTNEAVRVSEGLWLAGLDDALVGWPDADAALAPVPDGAFTVALIHCPVLFDDVESLFLARGSGGAREWHFSQNSVFFHAIDELNTARTAVVLTTNRIDLVDEAIVDRFLQYEFGVPPQNVLLVKLALTE